MHGKSLHPSSVSSSSSSPTLQILSPTESIRISIKEVTAHRFTLLQVADATAVAVEWGAIGKANDVVGVRRRVRKAKWYRKDGKGNGTAKVSLR